MTETNKKGRRGGRREGAGRPKDDSKLFTFRVPGNIARHIEAQLNKTDFIKDCIIKELNGRGKTKAREAKEPVIHSRRNCRFSDSFV